MVGKGSRVGDRDGFIVRRSSIGHSSQTSKTPN